MRIEEVIAALAAIRDKHGNLKARMADGEPVVTVAFVPPDEKINRLCREQGRDTGENRVDAARLTVNSHAVFEVVRGRGGCRGRSVR